MSPTLTSGTESVTSGKKCYKMSMKVWVCHFVQSALTLVSDCRFVGRQEEDLKYVYVLGPPQVYLATLP